MNEPNAYSREWFDVFLRTFDPEQTAREVDFLCRQLPIESYSRVLDVCCGEGRHAIPLGAHGYRVTGVDRDDAVLASARSRGNNNARFIQCDMRNLAALGEQFDAAICMWQSFGYFDEATNAKVLGDVARLLRAGGRFVLDVCHREFFRRVPGVRKFEKGGSHVVETRQLQGNRQRVTLSYPPPRAPDVFEWQLFIPEELIAMGASCGLKAAVICSGFDEHTPASDTASRMQIVFERGQSPLTTIVPFIRG
jgi:SAM-dependent methyltransferase